MYEPRVLDDETIVGIILGHADTEDYLNRPKKNLRHKPSNPKVPKKKRDCMPSLQSFLPEATKMKQEMLRGPCLKTSLVLSVFFSIAGIALVVVGTVMLTRPSTSSGNHQWMLILGLLIVFVAIASYLCLRNYCVYHLGDAPVKVLSIEGEELKSTCQYQLVKSKYESTENECTVGETDPSHLKEEDPSLKIFSDGRKDEILASSGDMLSNRTENVTFKDEGRVEPASQHRSSSNMKSHLDFQSDVEFQRELRRMSKVSQV